MKSPTDLRAWQLSRLPGLRERSFPVSCHVDDVSLVIYSFPPKGREDEMFQWIEHSILHSWATLGKLKTVIIVHAKFRAAEAFAALHHDTVDLQVEPAIVPGDIKTMSMDCIKKLHSRFATPYCLVIQDDGMPLTANLGDFIGKYDYIGAPIISDGWRRTLAYALGLGCFNGGFSLRSKRFCEYASAKWSSFFSKFMSDGRLHLGEDVYYTTLLKLLPMTWLRFRFPSLRKAFAFAADSLGGYVSIPRRLRPFGFHGKDTFTKISPPDRDVTILAYHFWGVDGYEDAFAKIERAFHETWRHCGRLKSVLVVNEVRSCVERFAAANPNIEVQMEPSLIPGRIFTMSADMNSRLYERFSTPYVLIIQSDGYPLRRGLGDFVGRYDFIGAPYVGLSWWKQTLANCANYHMQNGGFSLRSRAICEAAARLWNSKYHSLGDCMESSEDIFYTATLIRKEPQYRKTFRLATTAESLAFSWDAKMPIPAPGALPFGFHGDDSLKLLKDRFPVESADPGNMPA